MSPRLDPDFIEAYQNCQKTMTSISAIDQENMSKDTKFIIENFPAKTIQFSDSDISCLPFFELGIKRK